ncbi:MAG: hypothetical protein WC618_05825, partial [Patescibacteria group bacterium]
MKRAEGLTKKAAAVVFVSCLLIFSFASVSPAQAGWVEDIGSGLKTGAAKVGGFFVGIKDSFVTVGQSIAGIVSGEDKGSTAPAKTPAATKTLPSQKRPASAVSNGTVPVVPAEEVRTVQETFPSAVNINNSGAAPAPQTAAAYTAPSAARASSAAASISYKAPQSSASASSGSGGSSESANSPSVYPASPVFKSVTSDGNIYVGDNIVIDAATGIATLTGLRVTGNVDFSGANVKGVQQIVNNYGGTAPPMVVYNERTKANESWEVLSGNIGGVSNDFSVGRNLVVENIATISSILNVGNSTNNNGTFNVYGASTFAGATTFNGAMRMNSPVTVSSSLNVMGDTTLGDASTDVIQINGKIQASSTLLVANAAGSDDFYVSNGASRFGNTDASSTLAVYGDTTLTGDLFSQHNNAYDLGAYGTAWNDIFASNTLVLGTIDAVTLGASAGDLNVGNRLLVDGAVFTSSSLLIGDAAGDNSFEVTDNTVSVGSATGSSTLAVYNTLTVTGNVNPQHNDTYDLGVYGAAWQDVFASGTMVMGHAVGEVDFTVVDDAVAVGTTINSSTLAVYGNATLTGNLLSQHNNAYDLGAFGTAWNDIFASNTLVLGTIDAVTLGTSAGDLNVGNRLLVD